MPIKYEIRYSKYMNINKTEIKTESIFTKSFIVNPKSISHILLGCTISQHLLYKLVMLLCRLMARSASLYIFIGHFRNPVKLWGHSNMNLDFIQLINLSKNFIYTKKVALTFLWNIFI